MFDMMNMLGKVKEVQAKLKQAKENLVNITATGESGGGMVKATVNGDRKVIQISIDPDIIKKEDKDIIQDLTVAAINAAMVKIEEKIKEELKKSTEGVMPSIPGFDLTNFM